MKKIASCINDIISGVLSGLIIVVIAIAFAALVFKGPLIMYFSIGVTSALIGSCIVNFLTASTSSFQFGIARAEPAVGAILAIIFANITGYHLSTSALLPTLLATLILVSFLIGITMFFLGFFRLGQIARFLPFPVLGGIVTGTAFIMVQSSLLLIVDNTFTLDHLTKFQTVAEYSIGIGFSFLLLLILKHNTRSWLLPTSIVVASVIVNLILRLYNVSQAEAIQDGWLFHSFNPTFALKSMNLAMIEQIQWPTIFYQINYIASLIGVIIILLLLNVSGLETIVKGKADLDQELKIAGVGNITSSILMGVPANLSLSGTLLNKNAGAQNRVSGWVASLICLIILFIFPELVSYLPKPIIGGLLLYIGFKLLIEWLYEGWKKLPNVDYLIVLSILVTVAILGFLPGVFVGIIITCIVFIIRYARIDAIKFATNGINYHSNVIRPFYQQKWQAEKGNSIQIFKLQGYLFFGSAKLLLDKVSSLINSDIRKEIKFLIFDFQLVNGIDSSAIYSFIRLKQYTDNFQLQFIFTSCSKQLIPQFKQQGIINDDSRVILFPDLDQGMEWCENELLKMMPEALQQQNTSISNTLSQLIPDKYKMEIFETYLEKMNVPKNTILFKQGDVVDCLYFIETGEVAVFIESEQSVVRVSKSGSGTIVGEIGFYLHTLRTATVRTESDCVIYKLMEKSLQKLESEHPEIASIFHKGIIDVLALRIIQTNYELLVTSQ